MDLYWNDAAALKTVISKTRTGKMLGSKSFPIVMTNVAIAEDSALRLAYAAYSKKTPARTDEAAADLAATMVGAYLPNVSYTI